MPANNPDFGWGEGINLLKQYTYTLDSGKRIDLQIVVEE